MARCVVLAALLVALAGCGGSDAAYEPMKTEPDKGSPGAAEPSGGKVDIAIRGERFVPATMRVREGQIVVWTNDDNVGHSVVGRGRGGRGPNSRVILPGGRFEYTSLDPGRVAYACSIHAGMRGILVVAAKS